MDKRVIAGQLLAQPAILKEALQELVDRRGKLALAEAELANRECHLLLLEGEIDGKNEQVRKAQILERTRPEMIQRGTLQTLVWAQEVEVEYQRARLKALRSVAKLLA